MESFQQEQNWLASLEPKWRVVSGESTPDLKITQDYLKALGDPDKSFKYRVIIGGTAGKGTIARKLCATLHAEGVKVTCLTSPHLQTPLERIKIGDKLVALESFAKALKSIRLLGDKFPSPTQYEAMVLAGVLCGTYENSEILIAEVGLGGALDSVNALRGPRIAVVTFIGDDHRDVLGDYPEMAATKAAIFNQDSVLNLSYEKTYQSIFDKVAYGPVEYVKGVASNLNTKIVKRVARKILGSEISFEVAHIKLPARWEKIDKRLILDGSHSKPRFEWLIPKLKKIKGSKYAIVSMAQNHAPESFKVIYGLFDRVVFTQSKSLETTFHNTEDLQKLFPKSLVADDFDSALELLNDLDNRGTILVTGSFYFCGEVRERFYPSDLIAEHRSEFF